jgi:hypothetical protein
MKFISMFFEPTEENKHNSNILKERIIRANITANYPDLNI